MLELKPADVLDFHFIADMDPDMIGDELSRKTGRGEYFVILRNGNPVGVLRYNMFWDKIPFLNLIKITDICRNTGAGRDAMAAWEEKMRGLGHDMVLVSTQSDEDAQHFYRKIGYKDAGCLLLPGEAAELFFVKKL